MGRTAINVSGSMTAGAVTSRLLGETDMTVFQADGDQARSMSTSEKGIVSVARTNAVVGSPADISCRPS